MIVERTHHSLLAMLGRPLDEVELLPFGMLSGVLVRDEKVASILNRVLIEGSHHEGRRLEDVRLRLLPF